MNDNSGSGSATHFKVLYQHFFLKLAFLFCVVFCWALFGVCFVSFSVCPPYFLSSHLWLLNSNLFCVLQSVNRILEWGSNIVQIYHGIVIANTFLMTLHHVVKHTLKCIVFVLGHWNHNIHVKLVDLLRHIAQTRKYLLWFLNYAFLVNLYVPNIQIGWNSSDHINDATTCVLMYTALI